MLAILTDGFDILGVSANPLPIIFGGAILVAMIANVQLARLRGAGGAYDALRRTGVREPRYAGDGPARDDALRVEHIGKRFGAVTALRTSASTCARARCSA